MMASMVAKMSSNGGGGGGCGQLLSLSVQEKGSRNKRKFRADPPLSDSTIVLPLATNNTPNYEFSAEKFDIGGNQGQLHSPCDMCGIYQDHAEALKLDLGLPCAGMAGPSDVDLSCPREEVESEEFHDADWSDLTESRLEELMLCNLDAIFKSAIKKIVAYGYTEEVATKAVLRSGLCYGSKDTVSNIVDNALVFLRSGQDTGPSREHRFEDLQQLEKYVLAELICVLREVRPFFSTGDAMWCLLICDMNVSHACAIGRDPSGGFLPDESSNGSSSSPPQPHLKTEPKSCANVSKSGTNTVAGVSNFTKPKNSLVMSELTSEKEGSTSFSSCPVDKPFSAVGTFHTPGVEEKLVSSRKIHSSSSKRESILRQKSFHLEKSYRTYGTKGSFRTTKFSSFILDKKFKTMSDSTGLNVKSASLKIGKAMAMGVELAHETGTLGFSSDSPLSPSSLPFNNESQNAIATSPKAAQAPVVKTKPAISVADTELSLSLPIKTKPQIHMSGQWVPQDKKDEMIIKLVPRIRELQHQLQEWTEWANQKVMQAARRLSKDKAELKTLRQEKEEVERLKREKQTLEENTVKKLSEMENALCKAGGQVERANGAVRRLEVENAALKQEMEAAKLRAAESAANCQEVSKREKKTLMKFQSWEKQKGMFQDELAAERGKLSQLEREIEQAKDLRNQLEARWKQEQKAKEELLTQANSLRKEREQLDESTKSKEDTVKLKAEASLHKYKEDIRRLEKEISQLRLKTESSKIAALKRGIDGSYASRLTESQSPPTLKEFRDPYMSGMTNGLHDLSGRGVKRERECVMCLSEEMSVVFLPCAHQVVCKMCNELHEKQGMNDCPSCRSPILRRFSVRYAHP